MKLIFPISINCLLVIAVYLIDKYTPAKRLPYIVKQIVIGLMFGAVSAFASEYGVEVLGTVANVRDAAPLSAGLIFGAPAGIISGLIGGLYRWFSVAWGAGEYTRLACTLATILAGLMAGALRRLMFDDKKPTWGYGVCITVVCEVVHMLLIFITNMGDSTQAFGFVKGATVPMMIGNTVAVGVSLIAVSLLSHERLTHIRGKEQIAQTFQRWLLICIVVAYLITSCFTYLLQNGMVHIQTQELFATVIEDVQKDVRGKADDHMADIVNRVAEQYRRNTEVSLNDLANGFGIAEINVVGEDGCIYNSSDGMYLWFNMDSTEQSRYFMQLLEEPEGTVLIQSLSFAGIDGSTMRKYAGMSLGHGEFIQVGYSGEQLFALMNEFVVDVTKNRHVGSSGFIAVCDEDLKLITETSHNGMDLSAIGIQPSDAMLKGKPSAGIMEAMIVNPETGDSEEHIYDYAFVEGYCIIIAMPQDEAMFLRDASTYNSIFMQVLIFGTLFVFIYVLIKRVIINNLRRINSTLAQITEGNLNVTVDVRTSQEFSSLSDDINSTVDTLKRYIAEAAARIDRELEYAKQIQLSVLPSNFPEHDDFGIYAQMIAAKEVGGDFYDFYKLDDRHVAFLVADVSGKGIPAAMFMMTAKTIIKDLAEGGLEVNEILTRANEKLCESNESGMFVTVWMGILDIETGKLQYANAGHNPPLIKGSGGRFEYLRTRPGFVLAGMDGVRYRIGEHQLEYGDRVFLYTDGVTEATDTNNELFGEDRLARFLCDNAELDARRLLPALKQNIDGFVGEAPQFDDITMLVLDYKPKKGSDSMTSRTFSAKTEALNDVLGFIEEQLESHECSMKLQMALCVAIEEVFVNVAHYAYGEGEGDVVFDVIYDEQTRDITFVMSDSGVPFDPLEKPDPDITLSAQDRQIGGLGIFITKKTMDSVTYAYENGRNILTMIKKI